MDRDSGYIKILLALAVASAAVGVALLFNSGNHNKNRQTNNNNSNKTYISGQYTDEYEYVSNLGSISLGGESEPDDQNQTEETDIPSAKDIPYDNLINYGDGTNAFYLGDGQQSHANGKFIYFECLDFVEETNTFVYAYQVLLSSNGKDYDTMVTQLMSNNYSTGAYQVMASFTTAPHRGGEKSMFAQKLGANNGAMYDNYGYSMTPSESNYFFYFDGSFYYYRWNSLLNKYDLVRSIYVADILSLAFTNVKTTYSNAENITFYDVYDVTATGTNYSKVYMSITASDDELSNDLDTINDVDPAKNSEQQTNIEDLEKEIEKESDNISSHQFNYVVSFSNIFDNTSSTDILYSIKTIYSGDSETVQAETAQLGDDVILFFDDNEISFTEGLPYVYTDRENNDETIYDIVATSASGNSIMAITSNNIYLLNKNGSGNMWTFNQSDGNIKIPLSVISSAVSANKSKTDESVKPAAENNKLNIKDDQGSGFDIDLDSEKAIEAQKGIDEYNKYLNGEISYDFSKAAKDMQEIAADVYGEGNEGISTSEDGVVYINGVNVNTPDILLTPGNIIFTGTNSFLVTSLDVGVVRCTISNGQASAEKVMDSQFIHSWKLKNKQDQFIAVGFTGESSYTSDMLPFAKVIEYSPEK